MVISIMSDQFKRMRTWKRIGLNNIMFFLLKLRYADGKKSSDEDKR